MVVLDAAVLMLFLRPDSGRPADSAGRAIVKPKERVESLIQELTESRTIIIIPTPALSEVLVRAGAVPAQKIIEDIRRHSVFRIEPFDTRAAIELAAMTRAALERGGKRGDSGSPWAKLKFDRQIVAIAKVNQASVIFSDDRDIRAIAKRVDIAVKGIADIPIPEEDPQISLLEEF
jgi:predicted nucleic acid-binding protein